MASGVGANEGSHMHAVITTVTLKPGTLDNVAKMFEETYIDVVKVEKSWLSGRFTANRESNTITVMTLWTSADDYMAFRRTKRFQKTFAKFMEHFAAPPIVSVNEVLYDSDR
jgi:heme-degrading monooxygenase HmoA